jgi:hypothetical protein
MAKATDNKTTVSIQPPNFQTALFLIKGTAPFVQNKFSNKAREEIKATQMAGSTSRKGKKRDPKDFMAVFEAAKHYSSDGWIGIPAPSFRAAMISACRVCGYQMTKAKLAFFIEADGFDGDDGTPLVKITKGEPQYHEAAVRLDLGGTDIRPRPMWKPGWEAEVRIKYDADMFELSSIANLLLRAGQQVGIGEGRPDSKKSCGMGWGLFEIISQEVSD